MGLKKTFELFETTTFRRDIKKIKKQGKDLSKLKEVVEALVNRRKLPERQKDHPLVGDLKPCRECHIEPDWLLIYKIEAQNNLLVLVRTGSHAELFR